MKKQTDKKDRPTITRPFTSWYCDCVFIIDATRKGSVQVGKYLDCDEADGKTYLCDVFVHPDYRNRGIATRLINAAKHYCQRKDIHSLYIFCRRSMMSFYEKRGFENIHQMRKGNDGIPLYTMVCPIPSAKKPNANQKLY